MIHDGSWVLSRSRGRWDELRLIRSGGKEFEVRAKNFRRIEGLLIKVGGGQGSKKEEVGWSVRLPCTFNALKRQPGRYITAASGAKMSVAQKMETLLAAGNRAKCSTRMRECEKIGTLLLGSGGAIGNWIE